VLSGAARLQAEAALSGVYTRPSLVASGIVEFGPAANLELSAALTKLANCGGPKLSLKRVR
jgi:hypothetical protein